MVPRLGLRLELRLELFDYGDWFYRHCFESSDTICNVFLDSVDALRHVSILGVGSVIGLKSRTAITGYGIWHSLF